jgi:hypothetical protein
MNAPVPLPLNPVPPKRRWWLWLLLTPFATLVVLVGAAPTLVSSIPALRNWVVQKAAGPINGDVTAERLEAGWFSPIVLTNVRVTPKSGEPALTIERIESDRSLWKMATSLSDMGTIRIERPVAYLDLRKDGSNWKDLFHIERPDREPSKTSQPRTPLDFGVRAQIVDGTLRGVTKATGEPWAVDGLNLGVGLRAASRSPSGKQELLVDKGKVVDHREISLGLVNDVLKYAAPTMANYTVAKGLITIELGDWRLPVDDFASGELSGQLTMHTVDVGPGPIAQSFLSNPLMAPLIAQLQLPQFIEMARESIVPFKLVERRIYHEHLRFSMMNLVDIETHGFVGFDESLELTAELGFHPPKPEERRLAVLRLLTTQSWPINIGGKLGQPQVDLSPLKESGLDLISKTLSDIQSGNDSVGARTFQALNEAGVPLQPNDLQSILQIIRNQTSQSGPALQPGVAVQPGALGTNPNAAPPIDGAQLAVDILETLRRRREAAAARQQQPLPPQGSYDPTYPQPGDPPPPPPRRPLLRQGLRLLQDLTAEPPPPPPAPPLATPSNSALPPAPKAAPVLP